jgi:uncharacterized protein with HEPN domain
MPKRDDVVLLRDIQDAINQIESYLAGVSFGVFCETPLLQDGVMHRLEIIGEVSRNFSDAFLRTVPGHTLAGYHRHAEPARACVLRGGLAGGLGHSEN